MGLFERLKLAVDQERATETLQLRVQPSAKERLITLKTNTRCKSITELVRRALSIYDFLHEHVDHGGEIILKKKGQKQRVLVLPEFDKKNE